MSPETPPPAEPEREPSRPGGHATFGPEAATALERTLAELRDPDDALRILHAIDEAGASFAAYLLLPDTTPAAPDVLDRFYNSYADAWETFAEFRHDVLEALGWLEALAKVMNEQGIPEDHITWNHPVIDRQILDTYDVVHLDGWWHVFNK
ncbi:hypothetical protein [Microbacterium trichothecenolyticum]|uniref:Nucleotide-binding universal stress UspA family protein n=1 Tax=Microbacterium trichothecenolyticum TaxID=69370 RepID=A0ABU0TYX8_MICTR|nr:hypothetical protein [Microbacterium trichothecenolyticum]MDQ1124863.1 nucleotide-binding universal stress UspA family protein [Microbacterium trichothecenolyticum]